MKPRRTSSSKILFAALTVFLAAVFILGAYRLISGKPLGLRSFVTQRIAAVVNITERIRNTAQIKHSSQGEYTNIIFLHHSTGDNLILQGNLRELLTAEGLDLWDHGYNEWGLRNPAGERMAFNYAVPGDNTEPCGLADIFRQNLLPVPLNTLSALMQHEVIVIKSCFAPASNIRSDTQLELYQSYYLEMRTVMAAHPEHIFVILTTPPLNPAETDSQEAARAREIATWLGSSDFLAGQTNIFVFDFYSLLAEDDPAAADFNMLRAEYRNGVDSHPNQVANETIAPLLASFLIDQVQQYRENAIIQ